jgi:general secretion pathway protein M
MGHETRERTMKLASALQARWGGVAPREKTGLLAAAGLFALALVWWLLLSPPLAVLRTADAQHRALDAQLQTMLGLQAQAQALQSRPKVSNDEASRILASLVKKNLGTQAQLSLSGERATVVMKGVPADVLVAWLAQVRVDAHALPVETRLTRSTTDTKSGWDGPVVLSLPAP